MPADYAPGTVRTLLTTDLVTEPTRAALQERLAPQKTDAPRHFDAAQFAVLVSVCAVLMPILESPMPNELAAMVDRRLAEGMGDGWRYDALPLDSEAYRVFLTTLEAEAQAQYRTAFADLTEEQRETLLHALRDRTAPFPFARVLEELLAELSQYFYSHPMVHEQIGYVGMADGRGWQHIGLNEREAWEPKPDGTPITILPHEEKANVPLPPELPEMPRYENTEPVDAVIIGTGAGGAPLLARLAGAGLRVVALEAGAAWQPERDFATDEHAQLKLYWTDERLSAGSDPIQFGANNSGIGVGGTTLHFTAYTPRAQPDDLRLNSEFGVGRDWAIDYADIEPYYDELEHFLGISGPTPYLWGPERRRGYPLAPLPLNSAAQLMQRACEPLGIKTSSAANAALSRAYHQDGIGWRPTCTNRGFCQAGCSVRAKGSTDVTFIPLALRHSAEIRTGCFVTRIETDGESRVTGVVYVRNGREERQACKALFLCAGAIETPRLLLMNDLANTSGQVGKNFMAHCGLQLWGQFDEATRPYKGIPGGLISEDTHRPKDADFAGGYLLQSIGVMPVTYATQLARGRGLWGDAQMQNMKQYNHTAGINILGDCLPYAHNYLELSDELDGRGLPKPRIHFTAGENERRMTAHADRIMRTIWQAAGAKNVWAYNRYAHTIGTCRMGHDPADSVVNAEGRSHDIPNLYIADNSIFPSALSANPALTIMALSLRIADKFLSQR